MKRLLIAVVVAAAVLMVIGGVSAALGWGVPASIAGVVIGTVVGIAIYGRGNTGS